jgi:hypothetical protein
MQDISNRLHNNLVVKETHKKVLSAATSNQCNRKVHPAHNADTFNALQSKIMYYIQAHNKRMTSQ